MSKRILYLLLITTLLTTVLGSSVVACAKEKVPYAPDFTLPALDGKSTTLSELRGKPVMLIFWSINCPACQFQMPYLQAFYNEWSNDKIEMLTINVKDNASAVLGLITTNGFNFPVLLDSGGKVAAAYGLPGVPVTFLIDAKGIVKAYKIGPFQSRTQIEKTIKDVFPTIIFTTKPKVAPEIGSLAPDFTLRTVYGQVVNLNQLRGKTILLNFWVTKCRACLDELPHLQRIASKRTDDRLVVLAVNCGENNMTVLGTVESLKLSFPVLLDPDSEVCATYGRGCPTTFIIDNDGIIKAIKDDAFQSADEIEKLLDSLR